MTRVAYCRKCGIIPKLQFIRRENYIDTKIECCGIRVDSSGIEMDTDDAIEEWGRLQDNEPSPADRVLMRTRQAPMLTQRLLRI